MRSAFIHVFNLLSILLPGSASKVKTFFLRLAGGDCLTRVHFSHNVLVYGTSVSIGQNVWFSEGCLLSSGYSAERKLIEVGDNCDFGPRVVLCCGSHEIGDETHRAGKGYLGRIKIGSGCWVGGSAVLLGGVEIGSGCVVAGGAVVKPGIYPSNVLLAGNPAVVRKVYET